MFNCLNETIVYEPVEHAVADGTLPAERVRPWPARHRAAAADGMFTIGWIGWLVGARRTASPAAP